MPVKVKILPELRLHLACYSMHVTKRDFDQHWRLVANDPAFDQRYDDLVVMADNVDLSSVGPEIVSGEAKRYAEANSGALPGVWRRSAAVCGDNIQAMTLRLHLAMIDEAQPKNVEKALFHTVSAAREWLDAGRSATGRLPELDERALRTALMELGYHGY